MIKKRMLPLMCCFLIILLTTGCTGKQTHPPEQPKTDQPQLKILTDASYVDFGDNWEVKFRNYLSEANLPVYEIVEYTADSMEQVTTEILSGSGPDIINLGLSKGLVFDPNYYLVQETFADLQPLLEQVHFPMERFSERIIEACKRGGKLFFLPAVLRLPLLITSEKYVPSDNQNFFQYAEACCKKDSELVFCYFRPSFSTFINQSGYSYLDYDLKKAYFETDEMRELINQYRLLNENCANSRTAIQQLDALRNQKLCFSYMESGIHDFICYAEYLRKAGGQAVIMPFPQVGEKEYDTAEVLQSYAILKNSPNQSAAACYLKMLYDKLYLTMGLSAPSYIYPFCLEWQRLCWEGGRFSESGEVVAGSWPRRMEYLGETVLCDQPDDSLVDSYCELFSKIERMVFPNEFIDHTLIKPAINEYLSEGITVEQCQSRIQSDLNFYLNE